MVRLLASNVGHATILALAATIGMAVGSSVSAQTPRATSENAQTAVGTVTGTLGTGAVFSWVAANRVEASHSAVEVLCLDPSTEAVQPLFVGTDLVCVPH